MDFDCFGRTSTELYAEITQDFLSLQINDSIKNRNTTISFK